MTRESDGVEPPSGLSVGWFRHQLDVRIVAEEFGVPLCDFLFFGEKCRELFKLGDSDGGEDINEAVVVADFIVDEFNGFDFCCRCEVLCSGREISVVGGDHSATAGGNEFITVETERGHVTE